MIAPYVMSADMIAAFEAAEATGSGAINFRGKLVDRAMIRKARGLLDRFA